MRSRAVLPPSNIPPSTGIDVAQGRDHRHFGGARQRPRTLRAPRRSWSRPCQAVLSTSRCPHRSGRFDEVIIPPLAGCPYPVPGAAAAGRRSLRFPGMAQGYKNTSHPAPLAAAFTPHTGCCCSTAPCIPPRCLNAPAWRAAWGVCCSIIRACSSAPTTCYEKKLGNPSRSASGDGGFRSLYHRTVDESRRLHMRTPDRLRLR